MRKSKSAAAGTCEQRRACKGSTFSVSLTFTWYTYIIKMIFLQKYFIFALGYILQLVLLGAHFEDGLW